MMRLCRMAVVQVAVIATAVTAVHGAPEPLEILRQSILARTNVDFSGIRTVVVFEDGQKVHGVQQKIDCEAPENLRIVVIEPQSQRGTLCLTAGRDHWEYNPTSGRAVYTKLPPAEQVVQTRLTELDQLADRMKMQYLGIESIAGRPAHVVKVYTTRGLPVKKAWVDSQHHIELKTQRFDSHAQVKSSAYYTRIDYSPSFAPDIFTFRPPPNATVIEAGKSTRRMPLDEAESKAGFDAVLPTYLPPGYHFQRDRTSVIEINGQLTIWLSFSNGADTFSVFQRRASGEMQPIRRDRSITWHDGNYRFTLMGTLASGEAEQVKSSIQP